MTKTEKQKIQEFIGGLIDKEYTSANKALETIVAEKIKNQVRVTLRNKK